MNVQDISPEMAAAHQRCLIIDALLGGTPTMRAAGKTYLPKWPLESDDGYKARLDTATLFPALNETLKQMCGRVFFKQFDKTDVAKTVLPYLDDMDLEGNNIEMFSELFFHKALAYGFSYVVVDYTAQGEAKTLEEEKRQGARPYSYYICPKQVLEVRKKMVNGRKVITHFRYKHRVVKSEEDFGVKYEDEIVLLTPGRCRRWRQVDKAEWIEQDVQEIKAKGKLLEFVNVVELRLEDNPPLEDLAYLNVKHWQSQSDQDTILHTARVPLLKKTGVTDSDSDEPLKIGGGLVELGINQDLAYVEHTGAAIASGETSLEKLEQQMQASGAKLLVRSKIALTDSQAKDEQGKEISLLRLYGNKLEDTITSILDMFAVFLGEKDGGQVEISGNIEADIDPNASMDSIIKLHGAAVISRETAFDEAQRRGILSELSTWEAEEVRLDADIPRPKMG